MKTAKERFHEVMDSLGLSDYKVYTSIEGITKNMISKLRQGHTEEVSVKILMPFCEAFPQVNANYILTGRGSMFLENEISALSEERKEDGADIPLAYDELSRLYKATVSRYERLFSDFEKQFKGLKETFIKVDGELNKALEDVRAVTKKQKTA